MKLDDLIKEQGVEVHLVKEGKILGKDSRSSDNLAHGVHVVVAKYHLDNLREEVTKGMLEKAIPVRLHWDIAMCSALG